MNSPNNQVPELPARGRGEAWALARKLVQQIGSGKYPPGARLPSFRILMEEYGLSSGTVTYAMTILADEGHVERRHGSGVYVRGPRATILSPQQPSGLVALLVPEVESGLYLTLQDGMAMAAQANREQLITMATGGDARQQADAILQLLDKNISGVAIVPCYENTHAYQLKHLRKAGVPLVLLHRGVPGVQAPLIDIPFFEVGLSAGRAIGERCHSRVGAFLGLRSVATDLYIEGLRKGLQEFHVSLDDKWIHRSDALLASPDDYVRYSDMIERVMQTFATSSKRPTAVFASFDRLAEMAFVAAVKCGLRVPEDLSIVGFGGVRRMGAISPRIATVAVDEHETGRKAYELISSMREGKRALDNEDVLTMTLSFDLATTLSHHVVLHRQRKSKQTTVRPRS